MSYSASKKILIVEDTHDMLQLVTLSVGKEGLRYGRRVMDLARHEVPIKKMRILLVHIIIIRRLRQKLPSLNDAIISIKSLGVHAQRIG